ncbi:ferric reductase-like transmembrane domain-containing protein [Deinococcus ruber]|uniref:Ferric oxidoreductase domain-containing protein n=1 Tax=Deinococcus ruber TaxID=1848197 RepID=A0A918F7K1_9DEIO|nr:ferric reductase-like transmembrane domain-containing protein [Deinococcus ruber]GGR08806.1 hypothetical protein GCM10008957_22030 [Deinococcus ruber]
MTQRSHASGWTQLTAAVLAALNAELLLRLAAPPGALAERREEVYGGLCLLALLLILATRWLPRWKGYRRALGLSAFVYGLIHGWLALQQVLQGDPQNLLFLNQTTQAAIGVGVVALLGLLPLALTSTNWAQRRLGKRWKRLHRAGPWLTLLSALHTAWAGIHFGLSPVVWTSAALLTVCAALVLLPRRARFSKATS